MPDGSLQIEPLVSPPRPRRSRPATKKFCASATELAATLTKLDRRHNVLEAAALRSRSAKMKARHTRMANQIACRLDPLAAAVLEQKPETIKDVLSLLTVAYGNINDAVTNDLDGPDVVLALKPVLRVFLRCIRVLREEVGSAPVDFGGSYCLPVSEWLA